MADSNIGLDPKSSYYDAGDISTMDVIKAKLTHDQYEGFLLGNVLKYSARLNFKGCKERDAVKLANYSKLLNEAQ
jgi:hypothetical protein